MDVNVFTIIAQGFTGFVNFLSHSYFVLALKFFLFVYVCVLLVDIVLLLMVRSLSTDLKKLLFGAERSLTPRSTFIKRWEKALSRLESDSPSQYKVAILEADELTHEILTDMGYKGATMKEKLENIKETQLEAKPLLAEAHQTRNRIVHEIDFVLSREETKKLLDTYHAFFEEVELF